MDVLAHALDHGIGNAQHLLHLQPVSFGLGFEDDDVGREIDVALEILNLLARQIDLEAPFPALPDVLVDLGRHERAAAGHMELVKAEALPGLLDVGVAGTPEVGIGPPRLGIMGQPHRGDLI
ncbi:hypothetical protein GN316_22730, partial [Xylophilus sp. Kf1]|nr:hypothetical protein [Xylophilus sp. Kf1]